jgi:hypothetical protein
VLMDSTLPAGALSDPASAELPQNRASKRSNWAVECLSIEISQHTFRYARKSSLVLEMWCSEPAQP